MFRDSLPSHQNPGSVNPQFDGTCCADTALLEKGTILSSRLSPRPAVPVDKHWSPEWKGEPTGGSHTSGCKEQPSGET